jgi:hypothetical protein
MLSKAWPSSIVTVSSFVSLPNGGLHLLTISLSAKTAFGKKAPLLSKNFCF